MNKFACSCRVSRKKAEMSLARGHRPRAFRFHFFTRWQQRQKPLPVLFISICRAVAAERRCTNASFHSLSLSLSLSLSRFSRILFAQPAACSLLSCLPTSLVATETASCFASDVPFRTPWETRSCRAGKETRKG